MEQQKLMDELNYHRAQIGILSLRFTWTYCRKRLQFRRKRGNMDTSKGGAEA